MRFTEENPCEDQELRDQWPGTGVFQAWREPERTHPTPSQRFVCPVIDYFIEGCVSRHVHHVLSASKGTAEFFPQQLQLCIAIANPVSKLLGSNISKCLYIVKKKVVLSRELVEPHHQKGVVHSCRTQNPVKSLEAHSPSLLASAEGQILSRVYVAEKLVQDVETSTIRHQLEHLHEAQWGSRRVQLWLYVKPCWRCTEHIGTYPEYARHQDKNASVARRLHLERLSFHLNVADALRNLSVLRALLGRHDLGGYCDLPVASP